MIQKTITIYKEIFNNLKKFRKELFLTKYEASKSAIINNPYLDNKIKDIEEKIVKCEELFSRSFFVVKTKDYIKSCVELLNKKYPSLAPWKFFDHVSFKRGKLLEKVYLIPNTRKYKDGVLLLNNASQNDEYLNIAYTSLMPLTSNKALTECKLNNASEIFSDLTTNAWQKVEERLKTTISSEN